MCPQCPHLLVEKRIVAKRFFQSLIISDCGVSREGRVRVSSFRPRFCEPTSVTSGLSAKTLPCHPFVSRARRSLCSGPVGASSASVGRSSVGDHSREGSADTCLVAGVGVRRNYQRLLLLKAHTPVDGVAPGGLCSPGTSLRCSCRIELERRDAIANDSVCAT